MKKIYLKLKELRELGLPRNSLYYTLKGSDTDIVYELTFRYKGKIFMTSILKRQLNAMLDLENSETENTEFECVEVHN